MEQRKQLLNILEKEMLVNFSEYWEPDYALMMHIASFRDYGAHSGAIEETIQAINDEGGTPQRIKLSIRIEVEYLDSEDMIHGTT